MKWPISGVSNVLNNDIVQCLSVILSNHFPVKVNKYLTEKLKMVTIVLLCS